MFDVGLVKNLIKTIGDCKNDFKDPSKSTCLDRVTGAFIMFDPTGIIGFVKSI
jgi:hypothetical protein